jgi:hypothetical protein
MKCNKTGIEGGSLSDIICKMQNEIIDLKEQKTVLEGLCNSLETECRDLRQKNLLLCRKYNAASEILRSDINNFKDKSE